MGVSTNDHTPMTIRAVLTELLQAFYQIHPLNNTPGRYYHFPCYPGKQEPEIREVQQLTQGHTANGAAGLWPQLVDSDALALPCHITCPRMRQGTHPRKAQSPRVPLPPQPFLSPDPGSISSGCKHLLIVVTKHLAEQLAVLSTL